MTTNWSQAFSGLKRNWKWFSLDRFWRFACRITVRCAPKNVTAYNNFPKPLLVITPVLFNSPSDTPLETTTATAFPVAEYRSAMDSGVAGKAVWTHLIRIYRPHDPNASESEMIVVYGKPRHQRLCRFD
jgi:hypothetical protein